MGRLSNGDVCTMEGLTQKYYQHRVPKEKATGPRINLTWRWVKNHRSLPPTTEPGSKERAEEANNRAALKSESNGAASRSQSNGAVVRSESKEAALRSDRSELPVARVNAALTMAPVRFCSRLERTSSAATSSEATNPPGNIGGESLEKVAEPVSQSSERPQDETSAA